MKKKDARKRRLSPQFKTLIIKWLEKCAGNFRTELTKVQIENFYDHLCSWTDHQINTAFERAITECLFFPTVKEILERMPEDLVYRGPLRTCPLCEPDGWRVYNNFILRCSHGPDEMRDPNILDLVRPYARKICSERYHRDYDLLDATNPDDNRIIFVCCFMGNRARYEAEGKDTSKWPTLEYETPKFPRWPHLKGKGIAPESK